MIFEFSSGPMKTKVELSADLLRVKYAFRWVEIPLTQIVSARLSESRIGDQVRLTVECHPGTKPKRLTIFALGAEASFNAFVDAFKKAIPSSVLYDDQVTPDFSDLQRERRYAIGARILFQTLPRWGVLLLWWCLSPAVIPLFIALYLTKRYRLVTDGQGMTILRFFTRRIAWSEVESVQLVKIEQYVNGIRSGTILRFTLSLTGQHAGKKVTFPMIGVDGRKLESELRARALSFVR